MKSDHEQISDFKIKTGCCCEHVHRVLSGLGDSHFALQPLASGPRMSSNPPGRLRRVGNVCEQVGQCEASGIVTSFDDRPEAGRPGGERGPDRTRDALVRVGWLSPDQSGGAHVHALVGP